MTRLTQIRRSIIFIGLFFAVVYFCVPSDNYENCIYNEHFRQFEFEGVVIKKYLDKTDHSVPKVELRSKSGNIEKIFLIGDHSGLFDKITDGDSLRKSKGTMEVLKKVNNDFVRFANVEFNCDSVELKKEEYLFWLYNITGQH